ncbi:hypothetical protein B0H19DRAFT_1382463 [Mycena capillaripes]|nr:hypothetical protein B0H19DRAFT_1382463 [Mycena capillaripes]
MGLSSLHTTAVFDKHVNALILGLGIPGTSLTFLVLCAYGFAAWHPSSKPHLNRVSFRLLVYALVANFIFGVTFIIGTESSGPSGYCSLVAFLINLSLMFSAGMFFCMALNLQLTLVHMINGQKMEKYYIFGTIILCTACNVTPWNVANETCWFRNPDQKVVLQWLIGTQFFWMLLMSISEIIAFLVIVGYVISYELITRNYRSQSEDSIPGYQGSSTPPESPISMYRNIILRIGLYPLVSLLMNFSSCVLDLYLAQNPILTELNWRLGIADLSIFSARPLVYSVLALTDPTFVRAILSIHPSVETVPIQQSLGFQFAVPTRMNDTVHFELQSVDRGLGDKESSKDLNGTGGDARASFFNDSHEAEDTAKPLSQPTKRILSAHSRKSSIATLAYQI